MKREQNTAFFPEKFQSEAAETVDEYLISAQRAERYIAKHMRESETEIYWESPGSKIRDLTFYSGCAGILYFYSKLFSACPNRRYKEIVTKGTSYLLAHISDFFTGETVYDSDMPKMTRKGLYFGIGGIGLVLLEIHRNFPDIQVDAGAKRIAEYYMSKLKRGSRWTVSPAIAMDGGIILYLLDFCRAFPGDEIRSVILSAGEKYLQTGRRQKSGTVMYDGYGGFFPYTTPNWEFGSSGAGYVLTMLYDFTKDSRYLQAAMDTAKYILEIKIAQKKGSAIPYRISRFPKKQPIFYAGLCHGPVGTSRLFYRLYQLTGNAFWYEQIVELADGLESLGAPEQGMPGLWNNVSYCCGHGGFVHFFLALYCNDHNERWHDLALRSASILLGEMRDAGEDGAKWNIAWSRIHPERQTEPIGFFDGAAGIATVLLEMYLNETGRFLWNRLIDDPFPESFEE